jgi:hypothetical protein
MKLVTRGSTPATHIQAEADALALSECSRSAGRPNFWGGGRTSVKRITYPSAGRDDTRGSVTKWFVPSSDGTEHYHAERERSDRTARIDDAGTRSRCGRLPLLDWRSHSGSCGMEGQLGKSHMPGLGLRIAILTYAARPSQLGGLAFSSSHGWPTRLARTEISIGSRRRSWPFISIRSNVQEHVSVLATTAELLEDSHAVVVAAHGLAVDQERSYLQRAGSFGDQREAVRPVMEARASVSPLCPRDTGITVDLHHIPATPLGHSPKLANLIFHRLCVGADPHVQRRALV